MKTILKTIALFLFISTIFSCSSNDDNEQPTTTENYFKATIGTENFTTNNVTLLAVSAGNVQAFFTEVKDGKSFSSSIFPDQFPINITKDIAFSSSIRYKLYNTTYIPKSGTLTITILDPYNRIKGTFNGVFVSNTSEITISGEFDISN